MEPIRKQQPIDRTRELRVRDLLKRLLDEKVEKEKKMETGKVKKPWKFPFGWTSKMNKAAKQREMVLVFYLNIKGELEQPMVVPLYSGNMLIIRNKVYEVDPRAFWITRVGFKTYKLLIIKEIDRRPVSNLDYYEIRARGDSTDSDELLLKASLKAQVGILPKQISKGWLIFFALLVVGGLIWFFTAS